MLGKWLLELIAILNKKEAMGIRVTVLSRNPRSFIAANPVLERCHGLPLLKGIFDICLNYHLMLATLSTAAHLLIDDFSLLSPVRSAKSMHWALCD